MKKKKTSEEERDMNRGSKRNMESKKEIAETEGDKKIHRDEIEGERKTQLWKLM